MTRLLNVWELGVRTIGGIALGGLFGIFVPMLLSSIGHDQLVQLFGSGSRNVPEASICFGVGVVLFGLGIALPAYDKARFQTWGSWLLGLGLGFPVPSWLFQELMNSFPSC